jgi:F-type H+-transporting ATPase subunit delta
MAELATLARPYAEAVFQLAVSSGKLAQWSNILNFLSTTVQDPQVLALTANPSVDKTTVANFLCELCVAQPELAFDEQGKNFINLLTANRRLAVIPPLQKQFEAHKALHENYLKVNLVSAYEVSPEQEESINQMLRKRFGKQAELEISVDKSLIGGWVVRTDNQVIDMSVRGRLQQLAAELHG